MVFVPTEGHRFRYGRRSELHQRYREGHDRQENQRTALGLTSASSGGTWGGCAPTTLQQPCYTCGPDAHPRSRTAMAVNDPVERQIVKG
jgi:hypothetical protein